MTPLDVKNLVVIRFDEFQDALDKRFGEFQDAIDNHDHRLGAHDSEIASLKSEFSALKAQVGVKSRIAGETPKMTPFASRLSPVHPAGGNGSVQ